VTRTSGEGQEPDPERPPSKERVSKRPPSERPASRRRPDRLGDLLPETTRDESATAWGDEDDADRDGQLRREVPPHHG
jgi:hypothetical protein